jgi:4a-hydroxytetrahydrobiopterin dehydratase
VSNSDQRRLLAAGEVLALLGRLPGWVVVEGGLEKVFEFGSYLDGIEFVRRLGEVAEGMDHHPEMMVGWKKVRVRIMTHRPKGLTGLDEELAKAAVRVFRFD